MNRKTKAELETENKALRRQVEIQAEQISDLLDGAEWDQYKQKITDKAHDATIKKACSLADAKLEAQHKLTERNSGVNKINENAPARTMRIKEYFKHYRAEGQNLTNARNLANDDLADSEFKYRYGERWLIENLKD